MRSLAGSSGRVRAERLARLTTHASRRGAPVVAVVVAVVIIRADDAEADTTAVDADVEACALVLGLNEVACVMWDVVKATPQQGYVANPHTPPGSIHNTGCAVDLSV